MTADAEMACPEDYTHNGTYDKIEGDFGQYLGTQSIAQMLELQHDMVMTATDLGLAGSHVVPRRGFRNRQDAVDSCERLHVMITEHRASGSTSIVRRGEKSYSPVSPGLARLRKSPDAEKIAGAVVADQSAMAVEAATKRNKEKSQVARTSAKTKESNTNPVADVETSGRRGRAIDYGDKVITVVAADNPKRGTSKLIFDMYGKNTNRTVAEFVDHVVAAGYSRGLALANVRHDSAKGFIKLS